MRRWRSPMPQYHSSIIHFWDPYFSAKVIFKRHASRISPFAPFSVSLLLSLVKEPNPLLPPPIPPPPASSPHSPLSLKIALILDLRLEIVHLEFLLITHQSALFVLNEFSKYRFWTFRIASESIRASQSSTHAHMCAYTETGHGTQRVAKGKNEGTGGKKERKKKRKKERKKEKEKERKKEKRRKRKKKRKKYFSNFSNFVLKFYI